MAGKSEYLKKYLRSKGPQHSWRAPASIGGLKLGSGDEADVPIERKRKGSGGPTKKTLFHVLRKAADGHKYLFKDTEAEELPDSDEEEVRVVGEDGQTLALSEADKKKVAELIAKEEGRGQRQQAQGSPEIPSEGPAEEHNGWKTAFAIEEPLHQQAQPASAPTPYEQEKTSEAVEKGDLSNPRRTERDLFHPQRPRDGDLSPPRRQQQDRDLSPPRKGRDRHSPSPMRRQQDLSPPRRRGEKAPHPQSGRDRDLSASRGGGNGDLPLLRRRDQDLSPPRRGQERDLSPPRRPQDLSSRRPRGDQTKGLSPFPRTDPAQTNEALGVPGGVSRVGDSADHGASPSLRSADPERPSETERGAPDDAGSARTVVFRDREGRIISEEEWLTLEGAKGRKRPRERGPAPVLEWGSGLKQKEDRKSKKMEEEKLARQPFARYEIDAEYDADLKARDRWADPLAKAPTSRAKGRETGQEEEVATQHARKQHRPTCPHDAPPNRFGIKPGYRWDGVVRGNGYEEERLKAMNRRKWEAEMAHMNNTADM